MADTTTTPTLDEQVSNLTERTVELLDAITYKKSILDTAADAVATVIQTASDARDAAVTAQQAAEAAEANVATNATIASNSASSAQTALTGSQSASQAAATSESNAATSASNANTSEINAKTSEANSKTSETNSSASALAALTSENNAKTSEDNAATSAAYAATSETNALGSANTAQQWASYTADKVNGIDYSSKYWAQQSKSYYDSLTLGQIQADWNVSDSSSKAFILNKPVLSTVATSGNYADLNNKPVLSTVATSGKYVDLINSPVLSTVATSGNYADLNNKPVLSTVATSGSYTDLSNKPALSTVATSGNYTDLINSPSLSIVATSGSYADLSNKPALAPVALSGNKSDVGLGNVDNTSDVNKPVSTIQQTALDLKANLANPVFTGNPKAPTQAPGDNTTNIATTQFVTSATAAATAALVNSSPAALDTLKELADAIGDDPNYAATMSTALGNRLRVDTSTQGLTTAQQTNAKTNLGLDQVNNTSDANKPVSTATQSALDAKLGLAGGNLTGNVTFANNTGLFFKDTSGTAHQTLVYSSDNNMYWNMPSAGNIYWMNTAGSTQIAHLDNSGNLTANSFIGSLAWSSVTGKPTTIQTLGLTNFQCSTVPANADLSTYTTSGIYRFNDTPSAYGPPWNYGNFLVINGGGDTYGQIYIDYTTGLMASRAGTTAGTTKSAWRTATPTDGTGANGTWGINVTGTAASAPKLTGPAYTNGTDGWFRSSGATGWYNADYAVGIYASEAGNIRTYNNANFYANTFYGYGNGIVFKSNIGNTGLTSYANSSPLDVFSDDAGPAFMTFWRRGTGAFACQFGLDNDNFLRMGGWSAGNMFAFSMTAGDFTAAGNVTAYSDERIKTNWRDTGDDFVERWAEVKAGTYDRTDMVSTQVGLSAQSVREVLPNAVTEDKDGMLSLNYGGAAGVATVKLAQRVLELEAIVEALIKKIGV